MKTSRPPQIRGFYEPTGNFKRNTKRLPPRMREELGLAVRELVKGELSPGRRFEQLTNMKGVYSVRLSGNFRFVFGVTEGFADPIAVGPHDQAYADALRRHRAGRN